MSPTDRQSSRDDLVTIQMLENALKRVEEREHERDEEFHRLMNERDNRYLERHEAFKQLMLERDARYLERDSHEREAVKILATQSAEATGKLEQTLKEYREGANEWRDTVNDLIRRTPSGKEVDQQYSALNAKIDQQSQSLVEKINDLRETRSKEGGRDDALEQSKKNQMWLIGLIITVVFGVAAIWSRMQ